MNILFLTLLDYKSIDERNIYTDLLRQLIRNGHRIYSISPVERGKEICTNRIREPGSIILKLPIGKTQKTNVIEKGLSTITIDTVFVNGIKKYYKDIKFDLVLYSTPPITFYKAVAYVKKRDGAKTYLLLKDIFPQNAVDMGMMGKDGFKGILFRYFRLKEKKLYGISDRIGCMSRANMEYILNHNPEIDRRKAEICPNSIEPVDKSISAEDRILIRKKYGIPEDKVVFIYGGNLGKPQGIDFMLKCLHSQRENRKAFFLIIGDGTEYVKIRRYIDKYQPDNLALYKWMSAEDYEKIAAACDVGMIFLDHRFSIPNFPSRILSYMSAKLPVIACTDLSTDIGDVIQENNFGWWCESNDVKGFNRIIRQCVGQIDQEMGERAFETLKRMYDVRDAASIILKGKKTG